jgi:hypothetical protein
MVVPGVVNVTPCNLFSALHENLTRPSILPGFGFWGFGVRFWVKRNPDVVVAVGMWKSRVFLRDFQERGERWKRRGRAFSTVSPARHFHSELALSTAPVKVAERTLFPYSGRYVVT